MSLESAFGLSSWPFRVVVDEEFARVWADRKQVLTDISNRLKMIKQLPHSTIQFLWADFGAGKSHTLQHMAIQCRDDHSGGDVFPVYIEFPTDLKGFIDLYHNFVAAIDMNDIRSVSAQQSTAIWLRTDRFIPRDLRHAIGLLQGGDPDSASIAMDWFLSRDKFPYLNTLRRYGFQDRISNDEQAYKVLAGIIRLLNNNQNSKGVLWLIDELQRVGSLRQERRAVLFRNLAALFNHCPKGIHLFLSFSVAQQDSMLNLIPEDLLARSRTFPILALPYLTREGAKEFVTDLLSLFHARREHPVGYPFSPQALDRVLENVVKEKEGRVTPRALMEAFGGVLQQSYMRTGGTEHLPLPPKRIDELWESWKGQ